MTVFNKLPGLCILLLLAASCMPLEHVLPKYTPSPSGDKATATRQPPRPFCEEDVCDMIRDKTRTASAVQTSTATLQPTKAFCGEELCDQQNLQFQTLAGKPTRTSSPTDKPLYLVAILDLQGESVERQAVELFKQYGIPLDFESSSPGEVEWGQEDTPFGIRVEGEGQTVVNCPEKAAGVQERRQALASLGMTAGHLAWSGAGCDWSAMAQENGFSYGRAELHPLAELPERLHPWRAGAGGWDQPDPDGGLVVFPSGIPVNCMSELVTDPPCVLDQADGNVVIWEIEQALADLEGSRFSLYILSVSLAQEGDLALLEGMLQRLKAFSGAGQVQPLKLEQAYALFLEQQSAGD